MVSILGDYTFTFPSPVKLNLKLKDLLEDNVSEKYFLTDKQIYDVQQWNAYEKPLENMEKTDKTNISPTLTTRSGAYAAGMILIEDKYYLSNKMKDYITSKNDKYMVNDNNLVINREIACSKTTREGMTRADTSDYICKELPENTNILKIKNANSRGYLEAEDGDGVDISSRMEYHRGTVQKGKTQTLTTRGEVKWL